MFLKVSTTFWSNSFETPQSLKQVSVENWEIFFCILVYANVYSLFNSSALKTAWQKRCVYPEPLGVVNKHKSLL